MKTEDPAADLNRQLDAYAVANSPKRAHHSRLGSWPVYAAATGAALAGATAASADIIYSGPINLSGTSVQFVPEKGNTIGFFDDLNIFRHFVSSTTSNGRHIPSANLLDEFAQVRGNVFGSGSFAKNFPAGAPISGTQVQNPRISLLPSVPSPSLIRGSTSRREWQTVVTISLTAGFSALSSLRRQASMALQPGPRSWAGCRCSSIAIFLVLSMSPAGPTIPTATSTPGRPAQLPSPAICR